MTQLEDDEVQLLILGAGWMSTFLIPLCKKREVTYAATTRDGRDSSIPFVFDPSPDADLSVYKTLPSAETVVITFPLKDKGQSKTLVERYEKVHSKHTSSDRSLPRTWIQLGSSGIFTAEKWNDSDSPYDTSNARAIAEDELISLGGTVLNLSGLYGGARQPSQWLSRVATNKEAVKGKKALHLVHGDDVAQAILGVHFKPSPGRRWLITDLHVYDWWDIFFEAGAYERERLITTGKEGAGELKFEEWVLECMNETDVRALPRGPETLGRVLDGRGFWNSIGSKPVRGRLQIPRSS